MRSKHPKLAFLGLAASIAVTACSGGDNWSGEWTIKKVDLPVGGDKATEAFQGKTLTLSESQVEIPKPNGMETTKLSKVTFDDQKTVATLHPADNSQPVNFDLQENGTAIMTIEGSPVAIHLAR
jgi:hypothetical protein